MNGSLTFCVLVNGTKKFIDAQFMYGEQSAQAFDGQIGLSFFYPPVLNAGYLIIISKVFMTAISLLFTQVGKFCTNTFQCIFKSLFFHNLIYFKAVLFAKPNC
jgi:hypothetical protein